METENKKQHLTSRLRRLIAEDCLDAITDHLITFGKGQEKDMVAWLQEYCDKSKRQEINRIVQDYFSRFLVAVSPTKQSKIDITPKEAQQKGNKKSLQASPAAQVSPCGCMATRHKYFGSCIACGRIFCENEACGQCHFCNTPFVPPMSADEAEQNGFDESTVKAYRHKDKLLVFDRENAKRTQVHDAQADYYETGTWLTDEEKRQIEAKEKARREALMKSKRSDTFTLDIGSSGAKFTAASLHAVPSAEGDDVDSDFATNHSAIAKGKDGSRICAPEQDERDSDISSLACHSFGAEWGPLENRGLAEQGGKAGDVYRLLKTKMAPAAVKQEGGSGSSAASPSLSTATAGHRRSSSAAATSATTATATAAPMSRRVQHAEVDLGT